MAFRCLLHSLSRLHTFAPLQSRPQSTYLGVPPWGTTSPIGQVDILTNSQGAFLSAPIPAPGTQATGGGGVGAGGSPGGGSGGWGGATATSGAELMRLYGDLLEGEGGGELLPAVEMQGRAVELHVKVDDLERDLR